MANKHDVVVIGGGHNGLIVAAYLVKAGLNVCVIERQDIVGGGVATRELTVPGFKHDRASVVHSHMMTNPIIRNDELGLKSKYGLNYIALEGPQLTIIYPDDRALIIYRDIDKTCESIEQFSKRDAEVYPKFCEAAKRILGAVGIASDSPPPAFGNFISFLEASEEGRQYLTVLLSSPLDLAEDWFESDQMKVLICDVGATMMTGPCDKGTGLYAFGLPYIHVTGFSIPEGGSGVFSEALAAYIRDNGGIIRVSSSVKRVKVKGGEAQGVILDDDEEVTATKAVVSNVNVKQLFLEMLEPGELSPGFQTKVARLKHSAFAFMRLYLDLNEHIKYKAGANASESPLVHVLPFLEDFLRTFDECAYGIPNTRVAWLTTCTIADPSRAPAGKHIVATSLLEPYNLKEGGPTRWDEIKQEVSDGVLEMVQAHTTNLGPENILHKVTTSPLDFERYNPAWVRGDAHHLGAYLSQFFSNRPIPGWGRYRTPVKKLYMCGSSTHPAGGVTGGGRAAVQVIMEDLGIDFKKVIAK